jgi:multidrug efflux pump subunit AcrB
MLEKFKEFLPTSWSVDNKTAIYLITIIITLFGIFSYQTLPKDNFPEIVIPTIIVTTIYPGTSPTDMENLVTRKVEKQLKGISGVKKITSKSIQDFCMVTVEFNTDVNAAMAKQKVKDAVDKAKSDLPNDLPNDPEVMEVDFSEMPIMNINISGEADLAKLKDIADDIQDKIEEQKEITRCDMVGALAREVQVNIDLYKMSIAKISFRDIESAIAYENMTVSGGSIDIANKKRALRVVGEFENAAALEELIVSNVYNAPVKLNTFADVVDTYKEKESYARYNGKNVITLNVIKRSGENLINASDKIQTTLDKFRKELPPSIKIELTGDQSEQTRTTLHDLNNSIIIGFLLVLLVLMFFMGVTNAFFVALSVPLSIFLAFLVMPIIGFGLNMIVLFALLFALGIIVDDAIVVIENSHRLYENGKRDVITAVKMASGEVFVPVLAGTLTTLAPFIPLAFWQGIVGKFMFFLPITLIITLIASLIVAFIINPVFAASFMRPTEGDVKRSFIQRTIKPAVIMVVMALLFYIARNCFFGNIIITALILFLMYHLFLRDLIHKFEFGLIPAFVEVYGKVLTFCVRGWRPIFMLIGVLLMFVFSVGLIIVRTPPIVFFPNGEPNFVYVYLQLPVGTNQAFTDSITQIVEQKVTKVVDNNPMVESITSNVAIGASDPAEGDRSIASNKSRISVVFKKFADRGGSSSAMLDTIRKSLKDMQGVKITVSQEQAGPPVGAPISVEIAGDDIDQLIKTSDNLKRFIDSSGIEGIENLKSDFVNNAPELLVEVDRQKAEMLGISTAQVGMELRNAVFGKEVSKLKNGEDDIPIMVRFKPEQRNNLDVLMNTIITFRDMSTGLVKQIPISSVATLKYNTAYGAIKRKNLKRVITLQSNVLSGFNANNINEEIRKTTANFNLPTGASRNLGFFRQSIAYFTVFNIYDFGVSVQLNHKTNHHH